MKIPVDRESVKKTKTNKQTKRTVVDSFKDFLVAALQHICQLLQVKAKQKQTQKKTRVDVVLDVGCQLEKAQDDSRLALN